MMLLLGLMDLLGVTRYLTTWLQKKEFIDSITKDLPDKKHEVWQVYERQLTPVLARFIDLSQQAKDSFSRRELSWQKYQLALCVSHAQKEAETLLDLVSECTIAAVKDSHVNGLREKLQKLIQCYP